MLVDWNIRKYRYCVILTSCDASFGCLCFVTVNIFRLGLAVWIRQYIILGLYDGFSESMHRHGVLEESKIASVLAYKSHNAAGTEDEFKVRHRAKHIVYDKKYEHERAQLCTGGIITAVAQRR